ncbi:MAG: efflux RND transporter periplasmic adaptor subunit [Pseudomonadota bacterium]
MRILAPTLSLGAILTLILLLGAYATPASAQARPVVLAEVQAVSEGSERVFFGRVKARQTVDLAFQVGGQILRFPVDEGQPIAEGALVAELDLEPFELSLARARAQLDQAQDDFNRLRQLSGSTVSQVTIDDAETAVELNAIAVRDAERALSLATLRAPFDGIVARRNVPNFTTTAAGSPVVRLHDMSDLRVEIEVPEVLFQPAGRNPDVALEVAFAASDRRYPLAFREVIAETTQIGQSFRLTLGMTPPEDLFLLPGASATVFARMLGEERSLVIPAAALVFDPGGAASVFVFEPAGAESGAVRRQPVEIGATRAGAVEVTAGLAGGEEIVAAGAALLSDGDAVTRFAGFGQ